MEISAQIKSQGLDRVRVPLVLMGGVDDVALQTLLQVKRMLRHATKEHAVPEVGINIFTIAAVTNIITTIIISNDLVILSSITSFKPFSRFFAGWGVSNLHDTVTSLQMANATTQLQLVIAKVLVIVIVSLAIFRQGAPSPR